MLTIFQSFAARAFNSAFEASQRLSCISAGEKLRTCSGLGAATPSRVVSGKLDLIGRSIALHHHIYSHCRQTYLLAEECPRGA